MELFVANALDSLPKDSCTTEAVEAIVGNKVPEAFAKVVKVSGDVRTKHTDNLNRLIVKYAVERVNSSLDSDNNSSNQVEVISGMVNETKVIIKDLFVRLHASSEESRKSVVEPKSILKRLKGRVKGFFTKFTRKHSSKVAPVNLTEKTKTCSTLANKTKALAALIPEEMLSTKQDEELEL